MDIEQISQQWINGEWVPGQSTTVYDDVNPYNQEVVARVRLATSHDIDRAYQAAQNAQPAWAAVSPYTRSALLGKVAALMEANQEEIAAMIVAETGGTQFKAHLEVALAIDMVREAQQMALHPLGEILPSVIPGKENRAYRLPVGVVGVISPFNFPLTLSMRAVAPAIALGNSVVLKPDMQTFLAGGTIIGHLFAEAGLPAGVLNVVVADIAEVGDAMVEHPVPRVISFTGSTAVGRHIAELCGKHFKRASLELGGNNVMIVLADADLDQAVNAAVFGKFAHQGQICMCLNRILVDRQIHEEFIQRFVDKVSQLKAGDPRNAEVVIGPVINSKQADRVMNLVATAVQEGATIALQGEKRGNLITPFVLTGVTNTMTIAQSEIFGPVANILAFDTEAEAIRMANESTHGLSGSVFTQNLEHGVEVALQIQSGMVHVNDQSINDESGVPFGGEKASGLGRYRGEWGVEEFTTMKWVSIQKTPRAFPF
ncbi:MAG: aldehyde dehydrogenase family protein [Sulfobacillus thermotolerans]|nr:aldehyde dehydrogenase family protein [Sulfobacillus thermotolerans]